MACSFYILWQWPSSKHILFLIFKHPQNWESLYLSQSVFKQKQTSNWDMKPSTISQDKMASWHTILTKLNKNKVNLKGSSWFLFTILRSISNQIFLWIQKCYVKWSWWYFTEKKEVKLLKRLLLICKLLILQILNKLVTTILSERVKTFRGNYFHENKMLFNLLILVYELKLQE